ncbi:hypothetical protein MANI_025027 [Metarhizium anisopliae]
MSSNQHQRYAKAMMTWGQGYALFHPASDVHDQAKPGVCGYIDDSGLWQSIIDLNDKAALKQAGLAGPGVPVLKPAYFETWGPKYTDTVTESKAKAEAGVAAGIPVDFSTLLEYRATEGFAAVLLCGDAVKLTMYPHKYPFRRWAKDNAQRILQMCGDVAKHGFYVMTTTWSAQDIYINAWANRANSVTIGVKGSVPQAGTVSGSVQYHRGGAVGGWHQHKAVGDERRILFFGGLYFKFRRLRKSFREVAQEKWNGTLGDHEGGIFLVENGGEAYEVESHVV